MLVENSTVTIWSILETPIENINVSDAKLRSHQVINLDRLLFHSIRVCRVYNWWFHVTQVSLIIAQVKSKNRLPFNKLSQEIE